MNKEKECFGTVRYPTHPVTLCILTPFFPQLHLQVRAGKGSQGPWRKAGTRGVIQRGTRVTLSSCWAGICTWPCSFIEKSEVDPRWYKGEIKTSQLPPPFASSWSL